MSRRVELSLGEAEIAMLLEWALVAETSTGITQRERDLVRRLEEARGALAARMRI